MQKTLFKLTRLLSCLLIAITILGTQSSRASSPSPLQDHVVTGRIISTEDGQGFPGANIVVKGTTIGTTSDADGKYTLTVPSSESILIYSAIGYTTEERTVGTQTQIDISMTADITTLSEVVVVGYGTQKKVEVTNAIATFKTDGLVERPLARVDQALVGQMAGVRVKQTSGVPGKAFSVQVRGTGSIGGNTEPLYVIDGFPLEVASQANTAASGTNAAASTGSYSQGNPMDNLNPNDIESIQVLKDASAGAIYGSRAANGVVIITTKKGQAGKTKINFNYYTGWNEAVRKVKMQNAEEWIDRAKEHINYAWVNSVKDGSRTASQTREERRAILGLTGAAINKDYMYDSLWDIPGHPGLALIDWQDVTMRKAKVSSYQISASGGNDYAKYFISADYLDQDGILIGTDYKRYSVRANVEIQASKKLKFGLNIAPSYSVTNGGGTTDGQNNLTHQILSMTPVQTAAGGIHANTKKYGSYTYSKTGVISPYDVLTRQIDNSTNFRTLATIFAEYELLKGLAFRTSVNLDNADVKGKTYLTADITTGVTSGGVSGYNKKAFVNENTLNYTKTFAEKHNLSFLLGQSYNFFKFEDYRINGGTWPSDFISVITASNTNATGTTNERQNVLLSYFGRLQYNYNSKYFLSGSVRRDGSSTFGQDSKWGVFPSASVGWRIAGENFMESVASTVSDLKIRASWGVAGNNGTGNDDYASISTLSGSNTSFNGVSVNGQAPGKIGNEKLSWETAETLDFGLDAGFVNNRINLTFDYYTKTNKNLLISVPISRMTGLSTALMNVGEVENKGYEIELNTLNLVGDFKWNTSFNFSHNSNMVKKLGPNNARLEYNGGNNESHSLVMVGQPMYSLFLVKQTGILTQEDIDNKVPRVPGSQAGDSKFENINGDTIISTDDRQLMGNPAPKFTWGITNTFKYKNFDLTVFLQGQHGGLIYSMLGRALDRVGQGYQDNALAQMNDRWRSAENPGDGKQHRTTTNTTFLKNTDWLYSSDYWRVRNITLGYNLGSLLKTKVISNARIYVTAENWFGKDKYAGGYNPEAVNTSGEDYGGYPLSKGIIFGANFTF